ncbi:MAG: DNA pilot protein [Microviridae sp.]|nr:MAG: DNA pilot protein [Microviridae sp.]
MGDFISNLGLQVGADIIGAGINQLTSKQQYERQKNLMDIQNKNQQGMMSQQMANQMKLNEQGQQIQLDTWDKTNYSAQIAQLNKAGLNPALLYSKGGSGGTTGGQGGGTASSGTSASGTAQMAQGMNTINVMELKTMMAQKDLIDAQRKKVEAETPTNGNIGETNIGKTQAETANINADTAIKQIQAGTMMIQQAKTEEQITAGINKTIAETNKAITENKISQGQAASQIESAKLAVISAQLENKLIDEKISLTETQKNAIKTEIEQKWKEIELKGKSISIDQINSETAQLKQRFDASYPELGKVTGGLINDSFKKLMELRDKLIGR